MGNENITANAEAAKSSVENKGPASYKDAESAFLERRRSQMEARLKPMTQAAEQPAETPDETQPSGEPENEEVLSQETPETAETGQQGADTQKHLDNIDLDNLSDEEIQELAQKGKSRLLKRIAELTAKRKAAEEQLAAIKAEMSKKPVDPLEVKKDAPNPFNSLNSVEELQAKAQEIDSVIEEAEELLWANEHMAADDVIATFDGKEFTKAQIRKVLRDNQKARKQFLPARLTELQAAEQRKAIREQNRAVLRKELPWLDGEDNDVRKQYEALVKSPILEKAIKAVPELEPYAETLVAHAANSIWGRKEIPLDDKPRAPQGQPPITPSVSAARAEQPDSRAKKSLKDAEAKFKKSKNEDDFVALRAAAYAKRFR